jgi:hypothetical protein
MEGFIGLAVGGDLVVGCGETAGSGDENNGDKGRCEGRLATLFRDMIASI